jgi:hypothetical protein
MDWKREATQVRTVEEQRYCYTRAIEENEDDFEAHALLKALGPGPARAPRYLMRGVDTIVIREVKPVFEPPEPDYLGGLMRLISFLAILIGVVLIVRLVWFAL